jgi:hypothetical protein
MKPRRAFTRDQRLPIVNGMLAFVLIGVVLQLWLLTATMHAWLGGDTTLVVPGMIISVACLGLNVGLLVYLRRIERPNRN